MGTIQFVLDKKLLVALYGSIPANDGSSATTSSKVAFSLVIPRGARVSIGIAEPNLIP